MNVSLLTPTTDLQEEYLDFYNEWKDSGETMCYLKNTANFPAMVQELLDAHNGINILKLGYQTLHIGLLQMKIKLWELLIYVIV